MKRRHYLAGATVVLVAGCSDETATDNGAENGNDIESVDDDDQEESDDSAGVQTENGSSNDDEPAEPDIEIADVSLSDDQIATGDSVDLEVILENAGDAVGEIELEPIANGEALEDPETVEVEADGTETASFSWTISETGEYDFSVNDVDAGTLAVELSEKERAEQLLEEIQSAFADGVDRAGVGGLDLSSSPDASGMANAFDDMSDAIGEAMELQLTGKQMTTIDAIEAAAPVVRDLVDAHDVASSFDGEASSAIEAFEDGETPDDLDQEEFDDAVAALEDVRDAAEELDDLDSVDALEDGDLVSQTEDLIAALEAIPTLVDALQEIDDSESTFWETYYWYQESFVSQNFSSDAIDDGVDALEDVQDDVDVDVSTTVEYASRIGRAASRYNRASHERDQGDHESAEESEQTAEEYLDEAEDVGLGDRFDPENDRP